MDCSLLGSSVHEILQARILEWLPFLPPEDRPNPGIEPGSPTLLADSFPSEPPGKPIFLLGPQHLSLGYQLGVEQRLFSFFKMYSTLITPYLAQGPVYSKHLINVWLLFTVLVHAQSCPILCNLIDCSSPGSSDCGIS